MRALIVDDDAFDRETCRQVLESLDWEAVEAATPGEAYRRLADGSPFHAIVCDHDLKATENGQQVLAQAMRLRPDMRRILISSTEPAGLAEAREHRLMHAFVEKPDRLDQWRVALRDVLPSLNDEPGSPAAKSGSQGSTAPSAPIEERLRWLQAVVELGEIAHSGASLRETFDRAVHTVSEMLGMEFTKILRLLPGGQEVLLEAGLGWQSGLVGNARVSTGMDSQAGYTLASEHPVVSKDLREETRFSGPSLLHMHGVVSGVSVVIPGENGKPWGVFGAHTKERREDLGKDHALFLRAVANVVAGAIARDRTEETLRETKTVLEQEVAMRTRDLRHAVEDLESFNAMVAHDLRAPLRRITLSLEAVLESEDPALSEEAQKRVLTAERSASQMRGLLADLLDFAKATREPLKMEDVDVTALVQQSWESVRQQDPEREVAFSVEPGLTAHADPRLLGIVLDNLLDNAWKYTRYVEAPVVEVGSTHLEGGGTAFYVRDNGAGLPSGYEEALFHAFRRLHSREQFEGTGVGLTLVKRIIERHNGRVWAESAGPERGTTLYFRLLPAGLP